MTFILIGCLAFVFFCIFDLNKVTFRLKAINFGFAIGIVLIAYSTIGILLGDYKMFNLAVPLRIFFGLLSVVSLFLLLYTLFAALPFNVTYGGVESTNTVVDRGMYSLCRHPGVIWFFFFYFFLWPASGKTMIMWAGIIWTIMNVIYVYIEDRWFFPAAFNGYDIYKTRVPFLIPRLTGIKKCGVMKQGDMQ